MSFMDWNPLPPKGSTEEWDIEHEGGGGRVFWGVAKVLWWGFLGFAALVVLVSSPAAFAVTALLTAILWKLYKREAHEEED